MKVTWWIRCGSCWGYMVVDKPAPNLQDLQDIVMPAAPSYWPLTSGMWLIILAVLLVTVVAVLCSLVRHKKNAYRRAGLSLLDQADSVREINAVLKRVAMVSYSRERCAALYGQEWWGFLDQCGAGTHFSGLSASPNDVPVVNDFKAMARDWIQKHQRGDG